MLSIRKIGIIGRTYRNLNRYRQILTIFFKYGFGDLIELLKIEQYIEIGLQMVSKKRRERIEKLTRAERIRMALEELGPTYIKLGQVLSTRPDLIPVDIISELSKLQDHTPADPFTEILPILEKELHSKQNELFEFFEETPFASASIAQVYKARLNDGEDVAVKVQRPGIKKIIEIDLEIMLHLATLMEHNIKEFALHNPIKIVEEFSRIIERELDFNIEANNMERIARQFLDDPFIYIPKVFREATTSRVLTMEYISGVKVSDISRLESEGLDRKIVTERGADIFLRQVFNHGFFHADPHPGNIFVLPNNVICLLDFGVVGALDRNTREDFVDLVGSVVHEDESRTARNLLKLTTWEEEPDIRKLEKDISDIMGQHLYKPLKDIELGKVLQHLFELASHHRLRIPPDIFFMMKAFATLEGVALMLDPEFDMIARTAPFIERLKIARYSPDRIAGDIVGIASELLQFLKQFPKDMMEISRLVKQRKISIQLDHRGFEVMLFKHDQISNRISFSIIIASLIIGSALIVISQIPPLFYGISLIGIIVFLTAVVMGAWLLIAILKKGRL